jgi:putative hydrolases of HD superfamily
MTPAPRLADAVMDLGLLALAFGRVDRITFHEDGLTPESDTDHTVMLGLLACALADRMYPRLDRGLVAQFALVHDVPEVYAGDTPTARTLTADGRKEKAAREAAAIDRIVHEFWDALPWLPAHIHGYERQILPEARFVRAVDKLLPKITHIANGCRTLQEQGITVADMRESHRVQLLEIAEYTPEFPALRDLIAEIMTRVLAVYTRADTASMSPAAT